MLFTLKRTWVGGVLGLVVLALLGFGLRRLLGTGAAAKPLPAAAVLGVAAFAVVLSSDVLLHGLFLVLFGEPYRRRHRELAEVFRGQTAAAILAGALMAGCGEELVFRGLGTGPAYLVAAAVAFGLLHQFRRSLWPFTVWAMWQGLILGAALWWTGNLLVPMVAHFLHDLTGFLIFRNLNRRPGLAKSADPGVVPG
ncbi:MAG TPA: CPBP family intramembrane glutamic endopeptidase [Gemmataceae bacterium]|nr:CPBP family intramembrane glutamic endopeptidase [Gemmataceae bacterium]